MPTVDGLSLRQRLQIDHERCLVLFAFRALPSRRQSIDHKTCFFRPYERRSSSYPNGGTARQQNLLQRQRPMVIVRQVPASIC